LPDQDRQEIHKLDVAKRQLVAAIRLFFQGYDPIVVYSLAHNAREILAEICHYENKSGITDFIADTYNVGRKDVFRISARYSNFFKHANRDPRGVLDEFNEEDIDGILYSAVHDLSELQGYVIPVECQVYTVWFFVAYPASKVIDVEADFSDEAKNLLDGLPFLERREQKNRGFKLLQFSLETSELMQDPRTDRSMLKYYSQSLFDTR
jgi:hypothetical protein